MTIWKYDIPILDVGDYVTFGGVPGGAKPISVGWQGDNLCIWMVVDPSPDNIHYNHRFRVAGTGHRITDIEAANHVGTVQHPSGLVLHVFDPQGASS